jgi:hypothetical protein
MREEELISILDQQVARLSHADRTAVLLRFYERQSLEQVGETLGISEEAAKKRVQRAVEKLRKRMAGQHIPVRAEVLGAILLEKLVQPAPAKLAAVLVAQAAHGGVATGALQGATRVMRKLSLNTGSSGKIAIGAAGVVLAAGAAGICVATILANHKQVLTAPQTDAMPRRLRSVVPAITDAATPPNLTEAQWVALFQSSANKIGTLRVQASDHTWGRYREMSKATHSNRSSHWIMAPQTSTAMGSIDWDLRHGRILSTSMISEDSTLIGGIQKKIKFPMEPRITISRNRLFCQANLGMSGRYASATVLGSNNAQYTYIAPTAPAFLSVLSEDWKPLDRPVNPQIPLKVMLREYRTVRQRDGSDGTIYLRFIGQYRERPYWPRSEFRYRVRINHGLRVYRESVVDYDHHHHPFREFLTEFSRFRKHDDVWIPTHVRLRVWGYPTNQLLSDENIVVGHVEVHRPFEKGTFQIPPPGVTLVDDERYGIAYNTNSMHHFAQLLSQSPETSARMKGFVVPSDVVKVFMPDTHPPTTAAFRIRDHSGQKANFKLSLLGSGIAVSPQSFIILPGGSQDVRVRMNTPPLDRPYCFSLSLAGRSGSANGRKLSTRLPIFFIPSQGLEANPASMIFSPRSFAHGPSYSRTLHFLHPLGGRVIVDLVTPGDPEITIPHWSQQGMVVRIQRAAGASALFSRITVTYTRNGHLGTVRIPVIGLFAHSKFKP